jgi:hypothetical protein
LLRGTLRGVLDAPGRHCRKDGPTITQENQAANHRRWNQVLPCRLKQIELQPFSVPEVDHANGEIGLCLLRFFNSSLFTATDWKNLDAKSSVGSYH